MEGSASELPGSVLVVDDEPAALESVCRLLRQAGYAVEGALRADEALQRVRENPPDLILLDVVLPDADGVDVCRQLKQDPATRGIMIALLSAVRTESDDQAFGLESGADAYIARPIAARELQARIRALIRIKRSEDQLARANAELHQLAAELDRRVRERTSQLEDASQRLAEFTYSVSHDLRSPIRAVVGYASLILEEHEKELPPAVATYVANIHDAATRWGELTDRLLAYIKLAREPLHRQILDMDAIVASVVERYRRQHDVARVAIHVERMGQAYGDPDMLSILWDELVSNAVAHTAGKEHPEIRIGCKLAPAETVYFIRDNGVGFDMAFAERLFRLFESVRERPGPLRAGTGLAIVRHIAEKHGGRTWAEGSPGEGATFYFSLPNAVTVPEEH